MRRPLVIITIGLASLMVLAWPMPQAHAANGSWELLKQFRQIQLRRFTSDLTGVSRCWIQADFSGRMIEKPAHRFRLSVGFARTDFEFNVEVLSDAGWLKPAGHILRLHEKQEFPLMRVLGRPNTHLVPEQGEADGIVRELLENDDFYLRYRGMSEDFEAVGEFYGLTIVMAHALETCDDARLIRRKYVEAGGWVPKTP